MRSLLGEGGGRTRCSPAGLMVRTNVVAAAGGGGGAGGGLSYCSAGFVAVRSGREPGRHRLVL